MADGYLFIGAHARSGSTFLCKLLGCFGALKVYLEVFHFQMDVIEEHLGADLAAVVKALDLPQDPGEARSRLAEAPMDFIEVLAALHPDRILAFKVFPGHLRRDRLREVIAHSGATLLLRRNPLHSHISNEIAQRTNLWGYHDTSGHTVDFDENRFRRHLEKVTAFNQSVESAARAANRPFLALDYEHLAYPDDGIDVIDELASRLPELMGRSVVAAKRSPDYRKQDRRLLASEKVTNPEALRSTLEAMGLSSLDSGATPATG